MIWWTIVTKTNIDLQQRGGGSWFAGHWCFVIIAIIAGLLGFLGIAVAAAGIAKIRFFIFLMLFVISLLVHVVQRSKD